MHHRAVVPAEPVMLSVVAVLLARQRWALSGPARVGRAEEIRFSSPLRADIGRPYRDNLLEEVVSLLCWPDCSAQRSAGGVNVPAQAPACCGRRQPFSVSRQRSLEIANRSLWCASVPRQAPTDGLFDKRGPFEPHGGGRSIFGANPTRGGTAGIINANCLGASILQTAESRVFAWAMHSLPRLAHIPERLGITDSTGISAAIGNPSRPVFASQPTLMSAHISERPQLIFKRSFGNRLAHIPERCKDQSHIQLAHISERSSRVGLAHISERPIPRPANRNASSARPLEAAPWAGWRTFRNAPIHSGDARADTPVFPVLHDRSTSNQAAAVRPTERI